MGESETAAAIRRAGKRAGFHLVRAAVESLKALEVFVDELASVGRKGEDEADAHSGPVHIDIE